MLTSHGRRCSVRPQPVTQRERKITQPHTGECLHLMDADVPGDLSDRTATVDDESYRLLLVLPRKCAACRTHFSLSRRIGQLSRVSTRAGTVQPAAAYSRNLLATSSEPAPDSTCTRSAAMPFLPVTPGLLLPILLPTPSTAADNRRQIQNRGRRHSHCWTPLDSPSIPTDQKAEVRQPDSRRREGSATSVTAGQTRGTVASESSPDGTAQRSRSPTTAESLIAAPDAARTTSARRAHGKSPLARQLAGNGRSDRESRLARRHSTQGVRSTFGPSLA